MSVPNQKEAKINKEKCDKNNPYAKINIEALGLAMMDLERGASFKLWCYFAKNQNGFTFDVSSADVITWGIPRRSYRRAFDELVEKGYLVNTYGRHYEFYERPQEEKVEVTTNKWEMF